MADFIAVIRRAVTGLPNNTPEMRTKVYDKARAAVRRQLETMTPRPPEEMLQRQLDKLEAAIIEVDAEYAEALPALDDDLAFEQPSYEQSPVESPVEDEPEAPVVAAAEEVPVEEEEAYAPEPVREAEAWAESETVAEEEPRPAEEAAPDYEPEPVRDERDELVAEETVHADNAPAESESSDAFVGWIPESDRREPVADTPLWPEVESDRRDVAEEEPVAAAQTAAPVELEVASASEPEPAPGTEPLVSSPFDEWERSFRAPAAAAHVEEAETHAEDDLVAHFHRAPEPAEPVAPVEVEPEPVAAQRPVEMPSAAIDLLDWQTPARTNDAANDTGAAQPLPDDDFAAWLSPGGTGAASTRMNSALDELEFEPAVADISSADRGRSGGDTDDPLAALEHQAYQPVVTKRRNYTPLLLGLAGLVILAGGGYAAWVNRDAMSELVTGLVSSAPEAPETGTEAASTTPNGAGTDPAATTPAAETPAQPPADGEVAGRKFTQRLLPDGTEVDAGDGTAGTGEGRSVSEQNVAPSTQTAAASGEAPPATGATPPADAAAPVAGGERAIVYEERVGQPTPTAISGKVEWSVSREVGASGQPEPEVQGKLTVPESGLTALITFKRNTDNSLPASHLVEIVFSLPAGFEGGAIEDVQRVAMKRNEQDRGDPLVAVSAKITDDTFLIALNDFQDVVARNLDLLGTRNWIDIPVTYRNGRRALLTLDKGPTGIAAFEGVLKEWAALGTTNGG
ncbi:hypothetical protein M8R20_09875 [Pseudomonas sp. R2.Fl]|nr:hypothetical protein [Pseudomonas sp. R2.Fl]